MDMIFFTYVHEMSVGGLTWDKKDMEQFNNPIKLLDYMAQYLTGAWTSTTPKKYHIAVWHSTRWTLLIEMIKSWYQEYKDSGSI